MYIDVLATTGLISVILKAYTAINSMAKTAKPGREKATCAPSTIYINI
jgi:hypothetical protein